MKLHSRCYNCQLGRILREIETVYGESRIRDILFKKMLLFYAKSDIKDTVELGYRARCYLMELTGVRDFYVEIKKESNRRAMEIFPALKEILNNEIDKYNRFRKACLISIYGNIMEFFLAEHKFDGDVSKIQFTRDLTERGFFIDHTLKVYKILDTRKRGLLIYLTDNAGEIVFDKCLIETIKAIFPDIKVYVAVKSAPILNDATFEDALEVGLDKIADKVISTGQNYIGLRYHLTSDEFKRYTEESFMIFAKGMGHFESFFGRYGELPVPVFHLLIVKCSTVGEALHAAVGANIALYSG